MPPDPRQLLLSTFKAAVDAASPALCVPPHLPDLPRGRTIVVGAGKASAAMAKAVEDHWPGPLEGLVITRYDHGVPCRHIEVVEASHPVPDAAGYQAGRRILSLVGDLAQDDLVLCLISGGGSSLMTVPIEGVTLDEKQSVNRALLKSGAAISEMNCVRRHLSAIKGGRLAAACYPAPVVALLISDVPGDDPSVIASGPTVADPTSCADALGIIQRYGIEAPPAVMEVLVSGRGETIKPGDPRLSRSDIRMIVTPQIALERAAEVARQQGVHSHILSDRMEGESRAVARVLASIALQVAEHGQPFEAPCLLLSGGETTVTVSGSGRGDATQSFFWPWAWRLPVMSAFMRSPATPMASMGLMGWRAATSRPTALLARALGLNPRAILDENDSHRFFECLGDTIVTGPTLTNVNDFRAILIC